MELVQLLPIEQLILKESLIIVMIVVTGLILCVLFSRKAQLFLTLTLLSFLIGCLVVGVTLFIAI